MNKKYMSLLLAIVTMSSVHESHAGIGSFVAGIGTVAAGIFVRNIGRDIIAKKEQEQSAKNNVASAENAAQALANATDTNRQEANDIFDVMRKEYVYLQTGFAPAYEKIKRTSITYYQQLVEAYNKRS